MDYLVDTGVLHEDDVEGICKFLKEEPGINKQKIGDYLGDLRNPLSMIVLRYVRICFSPVVLLRDCIYGSFTCSKKRSTEFDMFFSSLWQYTGCMKKNLNCLENVAKVISAQDLPKPLVEIV